MDFDFDDLIVPDSQEPSDFENLLYAFFDKGLTIKDFCELPIPYIISMKKCMVKDYERATAKRVEK